MRNLRKNCTTGGKINNEHLKINSRYKKGKAGHKTVSICKNGGYLRKVDARFWFYKITEIFEKEKVNLIVIIFSIH